MGEHTRLPVVRIRPVQWLRAAAASSGMNDLYRRRLTEAADLIEQQHAALKKATHELNAIRARDGAPQHIVWDRGRPLQSDGCTHEYWDALTNECFAALAAATTPEDTAT